MAGSYEVKNRLGLLRLIITGGGRRGIFESEKLAARLLSA
jgi:hypothetical protein